MLLLKLISYSKKCKICFFIIEWSYRNKLEINLRKGVDLDRPTIKLSKFEGLLSADYCYIAGIDKYYFVDSITSVNNSVFSLQLEIDLLESYAEQIKQSIGEFRRTSGVGVYGSVSGQLTGEFVETVFESGVELTKADNYILSVRVNK